MFKKLTGSEAIYGFCAWLTTCKEITEMGSSINCSPIPDLIKNFCEINKLDEPRKNWTDYLIHPN